MHSGLLEKADSAARRIAFVAAALFFSVGISIPALNGALLLHVDEGYTLIKSTLISAGYDQSLIDTDQPPIMPLLLALVFKYSFPSVELGRLCTLLFSTILVWVFIGIAFKATNVFAAIVGAVCLILTPAYLRLSVSVMIGLPAFAFALCSIALLTVESQRPCKGRMFLSGLLLAVAVMTKLSAFLVLPACLAFIAIKVVSVNGSRCSNSFRGTAIYWLVGVCTTLVAIWCACGCNWSQLISSHISKATRSSFDTVSNGNGTLLQVLAGDKITLTLAISGVVTSIIFREWIKLLFPFVWLITALGAHFWHKPFLYYHYLHFAIPSAWLAALGAFGLFNAINRFLLKSQDVLSIRSICTVVAVSLVISICALEAGPTLQRVQTSVEFVRDGWEEEILKRMAIYQGRTRWVVTDNPILPFRLGLLVPPEVAVLSFKRVKSGHFSKEQMINAIYHYQPEQIVWNDWKMYTGKIDEALKRDYIITYEQGGARLLIRRSILDAANHR